MNAYRSLFLFGITLFIGCDPKQGGITKPVDTGVIEDTQTEGDGIDTGDDTGEPQTDTGLGDDTGITPPADSDGDGLSRMRKRPRWEQIPTAQTLTKMASPMVTKSIPIRPILSLKTQTMTVSAMVMK